MSDYQYDAPGGLFPVAVFGSSVPISERHCLKAKATGEYRNPKAGEYFLALVAGATSGAIVEAYFVLFDLGTSYHIAKLVSLKTCPSCGGTGKVEDVG